MALGIRCPTPALVATPAYPALCTTAAALVVPSMEDFSALTATDYKQREQSLWRLDHTELSLGLIAGRFSAAAIYGRPRQFADHGQRPDVSRRYITAAWPPKTWTLAANTLSGSRW